MVRIITDEGKVLDIEDSRMYIVQIINNEFRTFSDFTLSYAIKDSNYWGDCILDDDSNYLDWITLIARLTLDK